MKISFCFQALAFLAMGPCVAAQQSVVKEEAQQYTDELNKGALNRAKKEARTAASLQAAGSQERQFGSRTTTLKNGLQVVVVEDRQCPRVSVGVLYRVGSADDPAHLTGLSHMSEHMFFVGGSKKYPDAMKAFQQLGCYSNAFTSHDFTMYVSDGPASALEGILAIEADRMANYHLQDEKIFLAERGAVFQERLMCIENSPTGLVDEYIQNAITPQHPYGKNVVGSRENIMNYTVDAVNHHIRTWYKPNNAVLIVIGDVRAEKVFALAQRHFGGIAKGKVPERKRPAPADLKGQVEQRIVFESDLVAAPKGVFFYDNVPHCPEDTMRSVTAFVVGLQAMFNDYVFEFLRYFVDKKWISDLSYDCGASFDRSPLMIYVSLPEKVSAESFEKIFQERLAQVMKEGLNKKDFERAKRGCINGIYHRRDSHSFIRQYMVRLAKNLELEELETLPQLFEAVTYEEVMKELRRVLAKKPYATVWYLPAKRGQG